MSRPVDTHRARELSEVCTDCCNGSCCVEAREMLRSMAAELDAWRSMLNYVYKPELLGRSSSGPASQLGPDVDDMNYDGSEGNSE